MVRLVITNLGGQRHEAVNIDGMGKKIIIQPEGGVVSVTQQEYDVALPQLQSLKSRGYIDFSEQSSNVPWRAVAASVGALTLSGVQIIDGVQTAVNDIVLVKDQVDQKTNGLYIVSTGAWSPVRDLMQQPVLTPGLSTVVMKGTQNADATYMITSDQTRSGIDNIVWARIDALNTMRKSTVALVLYVNASTGLDSNDGLTALTPLLTIQAAISKIADFPVHSVTINVAAGTYAGFDAAGKMTTEAALGSSGSLSIIGELILDTTLASGNASDAVTTFTAQGATADSFATVTCAGANWTTNDLCGRIVRFTSPTNTYTYATVIDNTATSIRLNSIGTVTTSYTVSIVTPGTIINSAYPTSTGVGSYLVRVVALKMRTNVTVQNIDFQIPSGKTGALLGAGCGLTLSRCKVSWAGSGGFLTGVGSDSSFTCSTCVIKTGPSWYFYSDPAENTNFLLSGSTYIGNGVSYSLFVRMGAGNITCVSSTLRDCIYGLSTLGAPTNANFSRFRLINSGGISVGGSAQGQGFKPVTLTTYLLYANTVTGPMFYITGPQTNVFSTANGYLAVQDSIYVGVTGYLYQVYRGATAYLWQDQTSCAGSLGDIDLEGTPYTFAALKAEPKRAYVDSVTLSRVLM